VRADNGLIKPQQQEMNPRKYKKYWTKDKKNEKSSKLERPNLTALDAILSAFY